MEPAAAIGASRDPSRRAARSPRPDALDPVLDDAANTHLGAMRPGPPDGAP